MTAIPETKTGEYQITYMSSEHGECREYVEEENIETRVETLAWEDGVDIVNISACPTRQADGTPELENMPDEDSAHRQLQQELHRAREKIIDRINLLKRKMREDDFAPDRYERRIHELKWVLKLL